MHPHRFEAGRPIPGVLAAGRRLHLEIERADGNGSMICANSPTGEGSDVSPGGLWVECNVRLEYPARMTESLRALLKGGHLPGLRSSAGGTDGAKDGVDEGISRLIVQSRQKVLKDVLQFTMAGDEQLDISANVVGGEAKAASSTTGSFLADAKTDTIKEVDEGDDDEGSEDGDQFPTGEGMVEGKGIHASSASSSSASTSSTSSPSSPSGPSGLGAAALLMMEAGGLNATSPPSGLDVAADDQKEQPQPRLGRRFSTVSTAAAKAVMKFKSLRSRKKAADATVAATGAQRSVSASAGSPSVQLDGAGGTSPSRTASTLVQVDGAASAGFSFRRLKSSKSMSSMTSPMMEEEVSGPSRLESLGEMHSVLRHNEDAFGEQPSSLLWLLIEMLYGIGVQVKGVLETDGSSAGGGESKGDDDTSGAAHFVELQKKFQGSDIAKEARGLLLVDMEQASGTEGGIDTVPAWAAANGRNRGNSNSSEGRRTSRAKSVGSKADAAPPPMDLTNAPRRLHIINEIVTTERRYVQDLSVLTELVIDPLIGIANKVTEDLALLEEGPDAKSGGSRGALKRGGPSTTENPRVLTKKASLFMNSSTGITGGLTGGMTRRQKLANTALNKAEHTVFLHCALQIHKLNCRLLSEIEGRLVDRTDSSDVLVGDLFDQFGALFELYSQFASHHESFARTMERPEFEHMVGAFNVNERAGGQTMESYLILPVQRVPRYRMLLEDLRKHTPEGHPDIEPLEGAITKVGRECVWVFVVLLTVVYVMLWQFQNVRVRWWWWAGDGWGRRCEC